MPEPPPEQAPPKRSQRLGLDRLASSAPCHEAHAGEASSSKRSPIRIRGSAGSTATTRRPTRNKPCDPRARPAARPAPAAEDGDSSEIELTDDRCIRCERIATVKAHPYCCRVCPHFIPSLGVPHGFQNRHGRKCSPPGEMTVAEWKRSR
jgi:hypothetical protein